MRGTEARLERWLGATYFFHYAAVGLFMPYVGAWLASLGHGARTIGGVLALITATRIFAPPLWAWFADRSGRRVRLVRWSSLGAVAGAVIMLVAPDLVWLVFGVVVFATFWNAAMPQIEVTTLGHLGPARYRYAGIRLWGSVGFICTVVGGGWWFERAGLAGFPWVLAGVLALVPLAVWRLHEAPPLAAVDGRDAEPLDTVLRRPRVWLLFATLALMQVGFGPYYGFFTLYLTGLGYGRDTIGLLWALGVVAEIGVFAVMGRLLARRSPVWWLVVACVTTSLRWLMTATLADNMPLLVVAQVMHLASFGIYHAVAVHLILEVFDGRLAGRGQALHSSLAYGLGGACGVWCAGVLWETVSPATTFLFGAGVTALATCGALLLARGGPARRLT